jgi:DNA-directed RNA polymerase specialized sigma24 family protein
LMVRSMAAEAAIDADAGAVLGAARDPSLERCRADERLRACVTAHLAAVWRMLRRNGVPAADADDASQKVFLVLSRKLKDVQPGRELPFLLRTAVLVASDARRPRPRRRPRAPEEARGAAPACRSAMASSPTPPPWPPIGPPGAASNLMRFADVTAPFLGEVIDLGGLLARVADA